MLNHTKYHKCCTKPLKLLEYKYVEVTSSKHGEKELQSFCEILRFF